MTAPLTYNQETRYMSEEVARRSRAEERSAHFATGLMARGRLDRGRLEMAINSVVRRHAALRTRIIVNPRYSVGDHDMMLRLFDRTRIIIPGLYLQTVECDCHIPVRHVQFANDAEWRAHAPDLLHTETSTPVSTDGPMLRVTVFSCGDDLHLVVAVLSHLTADGWSVNLFQREVSDAYVAAHDISASSSTPVQHPAFAVWEHSQLRDGSLAEAEAFWQREWDNIDDADIRHQDIPFATARRYGPTTEPAAMERLEITHTESQAIARGARAIGMTPYILFRAAVLLSCRLWTERERVALWANFANRSCPGFDTVVGWCANSHLVAHEVSSDMTTFDLCGAVSHAIRTAQSHAAYPFPALLPRLTPRSRRRDTRVTFDWWHVDKTLRGSGCFQSVVVPGGRQWMDLDIRVRTEGGRYVLIGTYDRGRYGTAGVRELLLRTHAFALELASDPGQQIAQVIRRVSRLEATHRRSAEGAWPTQCDVASVPERYMDGNAPRLS